MMTWRLYVRCDRCQDSAPLADDANEARALASARGFVRRSVLSGGDKVKVDLCPNCLMGSS